MTDLSLTCRRTIKATPEKVYNAWLNPEMILKYMTFGPEMVCQNAASDPRVGGRFAFDMVGENRSRGQADISQADHAYFMKFQSDSNKLDLTFLLYNQRMGLIVQLLQARQRRSC